jgi:hypothetical protein
MKIVSILALALMLSLAACGGGTPATIDGKLDLYEQKVGEMSNALKAGDMKKMQDIGAELEKLGKELEADESKFTEAQKARLTKIGMDFAGAASGMLGGIFSGLGDALQSGSGTTELEEFGNMFKDAFGSTDGGPTLNTDLGLEADLGDLLNQ